MKEGKKRVTELDMVRGITIILVIIAHVDAPAYINSVLSIYRMPLFFMVSGYLFSTSKYLYNFSSLLRSRLLSLVLPYFSACLLAYIYWFVTNNVGQYKDGAAWYTPLIGFLNGNLGYLLNYNYPIWFLVCLFCSVLLFCLFLRLVNGFSIYTQIILFLLIGVLGYLISKMIYLPWGLDIALVAQLFLFIGYKVKEYKLIENMKAFDPYTIVVALLFTLSILTNNTISMGAREYENILLFYIGGISGSFLVFKMIKLFVRYKLVVNVLTYLGRESLSILIFHVGFSFILLGYIDGIIFVNFDLNWIIYLAGGVVFSLLVGVVIKKIAILNLLFNGKKIQMENVYSVDRKSFLTVKLKHFLRTLISKKKSNKAVKRIS